MALGNLEQALGVNPFGKEIGVDRRPEAIQEVETLEDKTIERIIKQYKDLENWSSISYRSIAFKLYVSDLPIELITPQKISLALLKMFKEDDSKSIMNRAAEYSIMGVYLSKLIQTSYDAGYNNFILTAPDFEVNLIQLEGKEDNPIHITIIGDASEYFGSWSNYCIFNIQGDSGSQCGKNAKNCTYIIQGNIDHVCGSSSKECNYKIMGNAGSFLGSSSKNCVYDLKGNAIQPDSLLVHQSIFRFMNKETYELFSKELPATNTVQLLDSNGKVIQEMKK